MSARATPEDLLTRHARGEAGAFDELYRVLAPELRQFLVAHAGDRGLAEDVLQTTFLKLWANADRYRSGQSVYAWARRIARNQLVDEWRRAWRRMEKNVGVPLAEAGPRLDGPAQVEAASILRAVSALPPVHARTLEARLLGHSLDELATEHGLTLNGMKTRVHRARAALQQYVDATPGS